MFLRESRDEVAVDIEICDVATEDTEGNFVAPFFPVTRLRNSNVNLVKLVLLFSWSVLPCDELSEPNGYRMWLIYEEGKKFIISD